MAEHRDRSPPSTTGEERAATPSLSPKPILKRRRIKWLGISIVCALFAVVVLGVLALTVFRFRYPDLKLDSQAVTNISRLSRARTAPASLNLTLGEEIRVRNQKWGSFKIKDGLVVVTFRGDRIGKNGIANSGILVKKRSSKREAVAVEAELIDGVSNGDNKISVAVEIGTYPRVSGS